MAEESQKPAEEVVTTTTTLDTAEKSEPPPPATEEVVAADKGHPAEPEKPVAAAAATEEVVAAVEAEEKEKPQIAATDGKISQSVSFKEETNVASELPEAQKKALDELKQLIQNALNKHEFSAPPPPPPKAPEEKKPEEVEEKKEEKKSEEEKKEEKKAEEVAEEEKKGEKKAEEVKEEEKREEEKKAEEVKEEEKKEEEKPVSSSEEPKTEEKKPVSIVEGDGEKTVEAIQESIVSVTVAVTEGGEEAKKEETVVTEAVTEADVAVEVAPSAPEEVEIWGIPLLSDERSDVILLKFLRARDFKVKEAFTMIKNTVRWRKEFGIESLLNEDLGTDWDKVVFTHGYDKEGHTVCYNVFGEFEDKELYNKTFSDEEKRDKFLRWRIQLLEKSVRKLEFSPSAVSTIVQVNDLRNSPGLGKRELRQATNQALQILQDNYPEFVAKQVGNWYLLLFWFCFVFQLLFLID